MLKQFLKYIFSNLYPEELYNVALHNDAADFPTALKTDAPAMMLAARLSITLIKERIIPVTSPDISSMDFCGSKC